MRCHASRVVLLPLLLLALLTGCATAPGPESGVGSTSDAEARAQRLLEQDQPLAAARVYRDLAARGEGNDAQRWRLRVVEILFDADYPRLALAWQRELKAHPVPEALATRTRIIDARAAIARDRGTRALRLLRSLETVSDPALRARILAARADAYALMGQARQALAVRIRREQSLTSKDAVRANQEAIWILLQGLSGHRLEQLTTSSQGPVMRGWVELGLAVRHARMGREQAAAVLADWRQRFPDHPASERFIASLRERVVAETSYPQQIALLLPLSGRLEGPGTAIRDGLMAAYYNQPGFVEQPRIEIYDTGSEPQQARAAYRQAVAAGAAFAIGPLGKSAVAAVAQGSTLEIPLLSLNYLPADADADASGKLYQFGLLPEDEAREAARAAIQNGHYAAVSLAPAGDWGGRLAAAFRTRFTALGGTLLEQARFNGEGSDYGRPIQRVLNLDRSNARKRRVQSVIGRSVHFEPRRRQDAGMVFAAAMPRQARLLKPQLNFYRAGDLPTYTTSHVFSGQPDPEHDRDLNGLYFTDLPWILDNLEQPGGLYESIGQHWPDQQRRFPRLYALGIDALTVLPQLKRLNQREQAAFHGKTGRLTMDSHRRIHRQMPWAIFRDGRPVPITRPEGNAAADGALGADVRSRANDS